MTTKAGAALIAAAVLRAIRERDAARFNSPAGVTATQSQADVHVLLLALDAATERNRALRAELEVLWHGLHSVLEADDVAAREALDAS